MFFLYNHPPSCSVGSHGFPVRALGLNYFDILLVHPVGILASTFESLEKYAKIYFYMFLNELS